ncbi:MAG TPA: hypothetical protein PLN48_04720 [Lachnospiraceae bacterium]|nr:hypothetical protein [Lachnospiraceae bacterium]
MAIDAFNALYKSGITKKEAYRKAALTKLGDALSAGREDVLKALMADLGKTKQECALIFAGFVTLPLTNVIRKTGDYLSPSFLPPVPPYVISSGKIIPESYGTVAVRPDKRFPFLAAFGQFLASLAAGNCTVLSFYGKETETAKLMTGIVNAALPEGFGKIALGNTATGVFRFDLTFRGEEQRGQVPAVVDATADLDQAAKKIVYAWRRMACLTGISPEVLYVPEVIAPAFIKEVDKWANRFPGKGEPEKLAVKNWKTLEDLLPALTALPVPPALYLFTQDDRVRESVMAGVPFGQGCINETTLRPVPISRMVCEFTFDKTVMIR